MLKLESNAKIADSATQNLLFENFIDCKQLAEKLSISSSYINKLKAKGMPHYKIGRAVRYKFSEVVVFLQERNR